ncbi:3-deoxy-D-manno-octulosonic acid transferase [Sulfitobacter sp. D35]|uniref:3-deoxy-D-manno-octulosonic acid transferase n=1 Tax=Sulfitobacter sp. D35 TaxID=3083252 RepID=UPI00296E44DC|nr:3-deoxy-D-manno-octulosonic acid transferase [Sulfitobacter sp. D35]MDW4496923.1 3-deoxy-D-manno-octulosonic acid transferase [Sulfitobacter sp. D35]
MTPPLLYRAYVALTSVILPFAALSSLRKLRAAGVPVERAHERLGHATEDRAGTGPLVWFHAASVGESLSVLALITRMGRALPRARFLITSGTPTSARLVAERMPPSTLHQYAPLDGAGPMRRFLDHWRPDAAVFVESEIWPQMLRLTRARGTPMALVNARLSAKSRKGWAKRRRTAAYVFDVFDLILTQNDEMAQAMVELGAPPERVARGLNLKSLSDPLPVRPEVVAETETALAGRPRWVAASTHEGEEAVVLDAHRALLEGWPDLCLILAPRHPQRGDAATDAIRTAGLSFTRRTEGGAPSAQVYLADTLGELGNWYALTGFVFLGGSLFPIGGHNPFEVAQAGAAVLSGPHVTNFAETFDEMEDRGAAVITPDAARIAAHAGEWLADEDRLDRARRAASKFAAQRRDQLDLIAERLIQALKLEDPE